MFTGVVYTYHDSAQDMHRYRGFDVAPYPADWALSRTLQWPPIETPNLELLYHFDGRSQVPHIYVTLFHRTKKFAATVEELVTKTIKHAPLRWAEAACLIIDFSITVLRSNKLGFHRFLNSQRQSIYWILDEALLKICLDQWEDERSNAMWGKVTKPISLALASAQQELPGWAELDLKEWLKDHPNETTSVKPLMAGYFERTSALLRESGRIYEIERTVRLSGIGQLPIELANVIIEDVYNFEKVPVGDLKSLYLPKGKGRAREVL